MKFKLVEDWGRLEEKINWTDEQIRDIIDMYALQELNLRYIAAKYNVDQGSIGKLLKDSNIQMRPSYIVAKKYPVYLSTISYIEDIRNYTDLSRSISLEYKPSIKLGVYSISELYQIYRNLRNKITTKQHANGSEVLAFYIKLLREGDKEKNLNQLISDILSNIDNNQSFKKRLTEVKEYKLITVDIEGKIKDNDLVEFYSFEDIAEKWLTKISSKVKEWEEPTTSSGKYLKELALQYYTYSVGDKDFTKVVEKYDLKTIIYSLFDKYGTKVDPTNYRKKINEIPYENEFTISSLEDLEKCFKSYGRNRDLLYGYMDSKSRIVYVGITQDPYERGNLYRNSDKENRVIAKALTEKLIIKLIIFKSYLPTAYLESSSKLLRYLEIEFAKNIFKTYSPENKKKSYEELILDGTLNTDKPGKNQSRYLINSIQNYVAKLAKKYLLSRSEYIKKLISIFGSDVRIRDLNSSRYSYDNFYLPEYISNHEESWKIDFLQPGIGQGKSKWLYPQLKSLDELYALMNEAGISEQQKWRIRDGWKEFHTRNNQDNIDALDDNIDGD